MTGARKIIPCQLKANGRSSLSSLPSLLRFLDRYSGIVRHSLLIDLLRHHLPLSNEFAQELEVMNVKRLF